MAAAVEGFGAARVRALGWHPFYRGEEVMDEQQAAGEQPAGVLHVGDFFCWRSEVKGDAFF